MEAAQRHQARVEGQSGVALVGQFHSGLLYQLTQGHEVPSLVLSGMAPDALMNRLTHQSLDDSFRRGHKQAGGPFEQMQGVANRVVVKPASGAETLQAFVQASH